MKNKVSVRAMVTHIGAIVAFALVCAFMLTTAAELLAPPEKQPVLPPNDTNVIGNITLPSYDTSVNTTAPDGTQDTTAPPFTEETTVPSQGNTDVDYLSLEEAIKKDIA